MTRQAPSITRRRKGEGHVTREAILEAARELFLSEGYERTTVRRIVRQAGVTPPVLYRHFADKSEMLYEIADAAFARLEAAFAAAMREPGEPVEVLRRMMGAYLRFGLAHPDEYRFVFMSRELVPAEAATDPPADRAAERRRGAGCFALIRQQVARAVEAGQLRAGDPDLFAELIWAAGHGLVSLLITHPRFPWRDRETLIAGMVALPLEGLLPH